MKYWLFFSCMFPNRNELTPQDILGWVTYFDPYLLTHSSL